MMSSTQVPILAVAPYTKITAGEGQTVFSTTWTANYYTDVVVYYTPFNTVPNDYTQLLNQSLYTVDFIGDQQTVQVTLLTPAVGGDSVTITRMTPADRLNLYTNTNFTPTMLNNDFGILTLVDQQNQLVNQQIAPRYNYTAIITPVADTILPILGPGQVWAKNPAGTAIVAIPYGSTEGLQPTDPTQQFVASAKGVFVVGHSLVAADVVGTVMDGGNAPSGVVSPGLAGQLGYYAADGSIISGLTSANQAVLITDGMGNSEFSQTLPSSLIIPLPYISGIINGSSAPAGYIGEFITSNINNASLTSTIAQDITHITLTAGDWDVTGNIYFSSSGGAGISIIAGWSNTSSASSPTLPFFAHLESTIVVSTLVIPTIRYNVQTTTLVYLSGAATFASGIATASGYISARRIR